MAKPFTDVWTAYRKGWDKLYGNQQLQPGAIDSPPTARPIPFVGQPIGALAYEGPISAATAQKEQLQQTNPYTEQIWRGPAAPATTVTPTTPVQAVQSRAIAAPSSQAPVVPTAQPTWQYGAAPATHPGFFAGLGNWWSGLFGGNRAPAAGPGTQGAPYYGTPYAYGTPEYSQYWHAAYGRGDPLQISQNPAIGQPLGAGGDGTMPAWMIAMRPWSQPINLLTPTRAPKPADWVDVTGGGAPMATNPAIGQPLGGQTLAPFQIGANAPYYGTAVIPAASYQALATSGMAPQWRMQMPGAGQTPTGGGGRQGGGTGNAWSQLGTSMGNLGSSIGNYVQNYNTGYNAGLTQADPFGAGGTYDVAMGAPMGANANPEMGQALGGAGGIAGSLLGSGAGGTGSGAIGGALSGFASNYAKNMPNFQFNQQGAQGQIPPPAVFQAVQLAPPQLRYY